MQSTFVQLSFFIFLVAGIATVALAAPQRMTRPTRPTPTIKPMWGSMFSHEAQGGNKPQGIDELTALLNNGQGGSATAAGAGSGLVDENGQAIGQGTGAVNAGPAGFGIAIGIGGAINTQLGELSFGQGQAVAVGK